MGCTIIPVTGDGNCCFAAVALALKYLYQKGDVAVIEELRQILPSIESSHVEELSSHLRQICVKEWMDNKNFYQPFICASIEDEACKFLQSGYFHGELGNTMVNALSNALGLVVVLLSSVTDQPLIFIQPVELKVSAPLFVAFNSFGAGHYDAIEFNTHTKKVHPCRCGMSDKQVSTTQRCMTNAIKKYSSRCPCYNKQQGCSYNCHCTFCCNPYGVRPQSERRHTKVHRARQRHSLQVPSSLTPYSTSGRFLATRTHSANTGPWSILEFFVLEGLIKLLEKSENVVTVERLHALMNTVVVHAQQLGVNLPISTKTIKQVQGKFKQHVKNKKIFALLVATKPLDHTVSDK